MLLCKLRVPPEAVHVNLTALMLCWNGSDGPFISDVEQWQRGVMHEKLKSTTVRFTDSDLHVIDRLQEKLGLGMIHVIRFAIRRLAENENLLPSPSAPKKR